MYLFDLTGRHAIVTGGSRGLGFAMAEGLCEAGAEVLVIGSGENAKKAEEKLTQKGFHCKSLALDLSDRSAREEGFKKAVEMLGGTLDILVNNAGANYREDSENYPIDEWDKLIELNLTAVFEFSQLAAKQFMAQGTKGKIINTASLTSYFGGYRIPAYAASKGGVAQLTKAFANEWTGKDINVNAIAPGYMNTDMNTALVNDPGRNQEILSRIPAHRWGVPDDVKGVCIFLASDAADYVSGAVIPVDGGYLGK